MLSGLEDAPDHARRLEGRADRVGFSTPYLVEEETLGELVGELVGELRSVPTPPDRLLGVPA